MSWTNEEYRGIKRIEHPSWEGWKIIDRLKAIYRDNEIVCKRAIDNDVMVRLHVEAFFEENK